MSKPFTGNTPTAPALRLLGGFSLERPGERGDGLAYEKGRALLAYVALEPAAPHPRKKLAALFWPDLPIDAALGNLRQVLLNLRLALNGAQPATPPLLVARESVRLDPAALQGFDVADFSAAPPACTVPSSLERCAGCLAQMEELAGLYRGELMAGFSLPDCPDFEDWLQMQRETLHRCALARLARLSDCHEQLDAFAKALPFAQRYAELAPWDEEGQRRAMRLLALNGQGGSALAQYTTCCRVLKNDLGVLPGEATRDMVERIRKGELRQRIGGASGESPAAVFPPLVVERRQVTILYCELSVGAVEDQDEAIALLHPAQHRGIATIRHFSGHVVESYAGGLLAYFGFPLAGENSARRALQAALAVTRDAFPGLEVRAGIHTGLIITGGSLAVPDAVGATTALAIRLRQFVENGEVAISGATQRLVAGYFDCVSLGTRQLSGNARPQEVFKPIRETGATHRLAAATKLAPLVGRSAEISALMALWKDAQQGTRRFALLRGDAGIGKSRLVLAVKERIGEQACTLRELRCFPEFSQTPFHPLIALYESALGFADDDSAATRFAKLATYVENTYAEPAREVVPLLAAMLGLPLTAPYREPVFPPQQQREETLAIVLRRLHNLAEHRPVLLVVEDMHWIDPSTLELLARFVAQERKTPILVLFTARPEFQPPWRESLVPSVTLDSLVDAEVTAMILALAPDIAPTTLRRLVERADGIPLFAEELAKVAAEGEAAIPATLHDLLATRLDNTGTAKTTAQLAATIGRKFNFDVLRRVSPLAPAVLAQSLRKLQDAGILWSSDEIVYQFGHALIRDAAYQSQTRPGRQAAHLRIAEVLQSGASDIAVSQPEILARHLEAGADYRQAIACWLKAGKLASLHSAEREAIMHFKAGLLLIDKLPADQESLRLESDLLNGLGLAAIALDGYASTQAASAHSRAMALCGQHEDSPDMFRAVWGLWASASSRNGYAHAFELAQQLLRMAQRSGDPVQIQQGHFALGDTLFWQGDFVAARDHLERAVALYRPEHHESHVVQFGEDARITSGSYQSWIEWFLGFPEQARKTSAETLATARRIGHPYSLAYALTFAALLHCRLRQAEDALALAKETLILSDSHGFHLWQIGGNVAHGWALAMQGRAEGVAQLRQCVEATHAAMGGVTLVVLGPLADAHSLLGQFEAALEVIDEALSTGKTLGDRHIEAELLCLKGESLLGLSNTHRAQAEICFRQALAVSRRQHARSLESRAMMNLAGL